MGTSSSSACSACRGTLHHSYFQANGRVLCQRCAEGVRNFFQSNDGAIVRLLTASLMGIGSGLAGTAIYTAVLVLAHINAALVSILTGWLVGKAVRHGSAGRGGRGYQFLATGITYLAIGLAETIASFCKGNPHHHGTVVIAILCMIGSFAAPVFFATHSLFGALITFFGLAEAWKLNAPTKAAVTGPHAIMTVDAAFGIESPALPSPAA
jgi:hypothetical protein